MCSTPLTMWWVCYRSPYGDREAPGAGRSLRRRPLVEKNFLSRTVPERHTWGLTVVEETLMPTVTPADWTTLSRVADPRLKGVAERAIKSVTTAPRGFEGEGFPVRRAFAGVSMADLDPFVHMDQMGEVDYAPGEPKGTPWHPHRGFETVTYMIDGTFEHQDSHGGGGLIKNGATQWMTAGSGILHIETPPEELVISGGLFHGIQLWVNLP